METKEPKIMAFDPKRHTIRVQGGREYLPVSARLVWFRNDHPDWGIVTQPVEINLEKQYAIFQCSIFNAEGKVMATATKMENVKGFGDYLEKAETGSVGRALAYCGYGTQFAPELEEGGRFSDAPLAPSGAYGPPGNRFARQAAPFGNGNGNNGGGNGGNYRPNNSNGGNAGNGGGAPNNDGNGNGGYNGSPRPLSPRPQASRPEPVEDESPFDDEMPRRAPASNGQDAPRAEASRPFPPRENINSAPRPAARPERPAEPEPDEDEDDTPTSQAPPSPAPAARAAAPGSGIQRVREPEPEQDGYDPGGDDEDEEDPFGDEDDLPLPAPVAKAAPKPAAPKPPNDGADAPAKTAPRTGIRPLGEESDGDEELAKPPLAASRCSVEGCVITLTPGQLTMSQNKFGRPLCPMHQKDATPVGAASGGSRRGAKPTGDTLL